MWEEDAKTNKCWFHGHEVTSGVDKNAEILSVWLRVYVEINHKPRNT